jgi:hypothetical protein
VKIDAILSHVNSLPTISLCWTPEETLKKLGKTLEGPEGTTMLALLKHHVHATSPFTR